MGEGLVRLIYCSRSLLAPEEAEAEIRRILDVSRRRNRADGLGGALLFTNNSFAQVLEGPQAAVEATFERIQCDARHRDARVIAVAPIAVRAFGAWGMGYVGRDDALARVAVDQAFALPEPGQGEAVLAVLRGVVAREDEWI